MSANNIIPEVCPICKNQLEAGDDVVQIHQKGADGINAASVKRGDSIVVTAGCQVHCDCRKRYTNKNDIINQQKINKSSNSSLKRSSRWSLQQ